MPITAHPGSAIERVVRHDRTIVGLALLGITILCWIYLIRMAAAMGVSGREAEVHAAMAMDMADVRMWGAADLLSLFFMWAIMMVGMMLPSAAPTILLVVGTYRRRSAPGARLLTGAFVLGYIAAWMFFSGIAATAQLLLHRTTLLSPAMTLRSAVLGGGVLIAAGVYQWLPIKNRCLAQCRSPLAFLMHEWREGVRGAFAMGCRHGVFCVGCCWALMVLLFAAGVMNLVWVGAIAAFVFAEKLAPQTSWLSRLSGALLCAWGTYVIVGSTAAG